MAVRVQRYPEGLLNLLQLRTSGLPPQELVEQVRGGIDMLPFYLVPLAASVSGNDVTLASSGAFGVSLTVPQNEFWIPRVMTLRVRSQSGASGGLVSWRYVRTNVNAYLPGFSVGGFAALSLSATNASQEVSWQPSNILLLNPGDRFEVEASYVTTGTMLGNVSGLVARIATN